MKSISLILSVAAFCNLALSASAADNYSLWPRRPAELEQARRLVREQKFMEAATLLEPFVSEKGIAGREARQITGAVNVRHYLSRMHPHASVCKVKRGDTIARIAEEYKCPTDVLMLLNGIVEPSVVKVGQKLVVVSMGLRVEIHPGQREISVWDGSRLVADYDIEGVTGFKGAGNEELEVVSRDGYIRGVAVPRRSLNFAAADRVLVLSGGRSITGAQNVSGDVIRMKPKDVNELTLLVGVGARVSVVRDEDTFEPQPEDKPDSPTGTQ